MAVQPASIQLADRAHDRKPLPGAAGMGLVEIEECRKEPRLRGQGGGAYPFRDRLL